MLKETNKRMQEWMIIEEVAYRRDLERIAREGVRTCQNCAKFNCCLLAWGDIPTCWCPVGCIYVFAERDVK